MEAMSRVLTLDLKQCSRCREIKSLDNGFAKAASRRHLDGRQNYCRPCSTIVARSADTPERIFRYGLKTRYGLTVERYTTMLEAQHGKCACCGRPERAKRHGVVQRLSIDHDHSCCPGMRSCGKCVRGLLCQQCNHSVGHFESKRELIERYLECY